MTPATRARVGAAGWILLMILAALGALLLAGCVAPERVTPPRIRVETTTWPAAGAIRRIVEVVGVGVTGALAEQIAAGEITATPDSARVAPWTAKGLRKVAQPTVLYWLGGGLIAAGALAAYVGGWQLGALLATAGIATICLTYTITTYPWTAALPLVGVAAAAAWALYQLWTGRQAGAALRAVVAGVEDLPEAAREVAKAAVARRAARVPADVHAAVEAAKARPPR